MNIGARASQAGFLGLMIDGARIVSPGMLRLALAGLRAFRRPVVSTMGFHLGPLPQMQSLQLGYDQMEEDRLLAESNWRADGYRLFEISALGGSYSSGWFQPVAESNCLFLTRDVFDELGGFDERFACPGGGLVNLDFYRRACELEGNDLVMLLGEGTFHQVHGGAATNCPPEEQRRQWRAYAREYQRLRGKRFRRATRRPVLFGDVPEAALAWIEKSCDLYRDSSGSS